MPKQTGVHEAELWLPKVAEWVQNPVARNADGSFRVLDLSDGITTKMVMRYALGLEDREINWTRRHSVGRILRSLGFQGVVKREWMYFPNYDVLGEYPDED